MPNQQPRDVTGGEAVWGAMIPGLGLVNYAWGLLTVPAEVFLRRNFGERWFTQANFIGGLIILLLIQFISFLIGLLNPLSIVAMVFGHSGTQTVSWMAKITRWYVILGIGHFLVIWWRNVTGTAPHSFSAGESWLRPIGRTVMWVLNLVLDNIVRLIFTIHPKLDKRRLDIILPVLTDVDTFTERWIEPAFVMFIALFAAAAGQSTVFFWLVSSAMALNMYNGIRHQHQRGLWLNMQDAMIEADYYNQVRDAERKAIRKSYERMVKRAAYEVQQNPDMAKIIERTNPSLADAIKAVNSTLHREPNHFTPGDQQQAA